MLAYCAKKTAILIASLIVSSMVIFALIEVIPGDAAAFMLGINAGDDTLAALRQELGLNQSPVRLYVSWISGMLKGDFGISYAYRTPIAPIIIERLYVSLPLALFALILAIGAAVPIAVIVTRYDRTAWAKIIMASMQIGIAIPNFWFAIIIVYIFAINLGWLPAGGFNGWQDGIGAGLVSLILPAAALALPQAAILARVMHTALLNQMAKPFIRTARAKGLSRNQAMLRHGLKNAMISLLTIIGLQFSFLLAGAIIIENIFYLPGLGRLIFQAIAQRDLIMVKNAVFLLVLAVMIVSFITDLAYAAIDPRLRYSRLRHKGSE